MASSSIFIPRKQRFSKFLEQPRISKWITRIVHYKPTSTSNATSSIFGFLKMLGFGFMIRLWTPVLVQPRDHDLEGRWDFSASEGKSLMSSNNVYLTDRNDSGRDSMKGSLSHVPEYLYISYRKDLYNHLISRFHFQLRNARCELCVYILAQQTRKQFHYFDRSNLQNTLNQSRFILKSRWSIDTIPEIIFTYKSNHDQAY